MLYVNGDDPNDLDSDGAKSSERLGKPNEAQRNLDAFWPNVQEEIKNIKQVDAKNQVLPLARIKKIMKLDENAKMIAAEAPLLFAKAAEIFIQELTLRAWIHTQDNKRRTLQRSDIATAISKCDQFDFLIDIVPREEIKPQRKETEIPKATTNADQVQYYLQLAQQHHQTLQNTPTTAGITQQGIPVANNTTVGSVSVAAPQNILLTTANAATPSSVVNNLQNPQQQIQFLQQVVTPTGEITHMPISLNQLNLLRMGIGNAPNTSQPQQVIIPTMQAQQPSLVQVTASGNQQNPTAGSIYLNTQNSSLPDDKKLTMANAFRTNC